MGEFGEHGFGATIRAIGELGWERLSETECVESAWAYYFFSIQFREHLLIARAILPDDVKLQELEAGECETDNLSPWPGVAARGERMNHDEFMRRAIQLVPVAHERREDMLQRGEAYLRFTREQDRQTRAMSIASYEDGGLEHVFEAMLRMPEYDNPAIRAFRHFLAEHIRFDSDPDAGHGALARHLNPDDRIKPLWDAFYDLLVAFVPALVAPAPVSAPTSAQLVAE